MTAARLLLVAPLACAACVEPAGVERDPVVASTCGGAITTVPIEDGEHLPVGSTIEWTTNPPATGAHYPVWPEWEKRYTALERAYYIHSAEHGGVVLLHRCADCPEVVDDLVAVIRALPADPHCVAPIRTRTLVVADPLLPPDVTVAAVAWGTFYAASCVDDALAAFVVEHYGEAGENTCHDGLPLGGAAL